MGTKRIFCPKPKRLTKLDVGGGDELLNRHPFDWEIQSRKSRFYTLIFREEQTTPVNSFIKTFCRPCHGPHNKDEFYCQEKSGKDVRR